MKTYKVQQILTLYMESTVEANSKKEALELLESGEGDFKRHRNSFISSTHNSNQSIKKRIRRTRDGYTSIDR